MAMLVSSSSYSSSPALQFAGPPFSQCVLTPVTLLWGAASNSPGPWAHGVLDPVSLVLSVVQ